MEIKINPNYPDISYLRERAKSKIPRFAFEYIDGGCNSEVNLRRNTQEIREVQLKAIYLKPMGELSMKTELFGQVYDAPFGIAPVGLQDLMWPGACRILAKAAFQHNIPFVLSTVGTASIETISEITEGKAWFQLYNPKEDHVRNDLLNRAESSGYDVLVALTDVPAFAYRPKEIKNGLAIPPKMTLSNILQILSRPHWAVQTLLTGKPEFKTIKPYIPPGLKLSHLGLFMNQMFSGRLDEEKLKVIRDRWKGKLVIKGVASEEDTEAAIRIGADGIIVSNHGGRQLDNGESTIKPLSKIAKQYSGKIKIMMDSGIRTGPDIASTIASGAEFAFMGRSFVYGVAALGKKGGNHTISVLKKQLQQVMEQLSCERPEELKKLLAE